jgi:DEAD/DEAH box helicase domain-containing protein
MIYFRSIINSSILFLFLRTLLASDSLIRDPLSSTAMLIFPTKALARDQLLSINKMFPEQCGFSEVTASCFDGDIVASSRDSICEHCPIILTNPDMLHVSILSNHRKWIRFFSKLKYVVIDEAHYYRAAFGVHVACILRRLRRVLFKYGASPLFILCSATVINPLEMAVNLTGIDEQSFENVSDDCSPLAAKDIVLFNPLNISPGGKTFKSACPYKSSVLLMKILVCHNIRTIVFVRARQLGESLFDQLLEVLPYTLHSKVACYRAGYSPAERQDLGDNKTS